MGRIFNKILLKAGVLIPLLSFAQIVCAQSLDRSVELPGGRMKYEEVFEVIEKQGNVWFGYVTQDIDAGQVVAVPQGSMTLKQALDALFDGTEYRYTVSGRHILIMVRDNEEPEPEVAPEPVEEDFAEVKYDPYLTKRPNVALKTNLLYDLTTTVNIGVEIGFAPRWTIDIPFNYNPWEFNDETRLRHWGLQPEVRYWFCERFDGWFAGLHGHYAKFNVGGWPDWGFVSENMQRNRYQGHLYGGGISVGYSWILKNRWSMEATVGAGYAYIKYDKYPCAECGTSLGKKGQHYVGPTKAGLSLVFMIK